MPVTPYVSASELKATLSLTGQTFADADITEALASATEGIERELGRKFNEDATDTVRLYTALDWYCLHIRDLSSLTTLRTDDNGDGSFETTWGTEDYKLLPLNAEADEEPYTSIEVDFRNGDKRFPVDVQGGVEITGKFGWPEVPASVATACSIIAAQLLKRRRENPGFIITAETAVVILRNDPQLGFLLKGLSRPKVVEN